LKEAEKESGGGDFVSKMARRWKSLIKSG